MMIKTRRILSSILVISVFLFPVAANAATAKSLKLGKLFKDEGTGFQMKLPKGWKKLPGAEYRVQVIDPTTKININVTFAMTENNFETELQNIRTALPQLIPGYQPWEDRPFKIKGAEAHLIGGTFLLEDNEVQNLQMLVQKDKNFYVATATAKKTDWNRYGKFFLKVFKTFRLIN